MYRGAYDEGCTDSIDSRSCGVVGWGAVALRAADCASALKTTFALCVPLPPLALPLECCNPAPQLST